MDPQEEGVEEEEGSDGFLWASEDNLRFRQQGGRVRRRSRCGRSRSCDISKSFVLVIFIILLSTITTTTGKITFRTMEIQEEGTTREGEGINGDQSNSASSYILSNQYGNVSTPLRESMRNRHVNVSIHITLLDFQDEYISTKITSFEELTGATVQKIHTTQASWFADIEEDMNGAGFVDLYAIFGNWIPTFVEAHSSLQEIEGKVDDGGGDNAVDSSGSAGGLLDITNSVGNQVGLDWFDIMPAVRSGVATYKNRVYTVPIDGDAIVMLYRTDLVEGVGLPTPRTWDDVVTISNYYSRSRRSEDGSNDEGAKHENYYANCFSSSTNDIAGTIFWAIASTYLQTQGTSQGTFFDPDTFEPKSNPSDNPQFLEVLQLYKLLVEESPYRDYGPTDWQGNLVQFEMGRCVLWYNYPGPTRILVSNQKKNNMTGTLNYAPVPGMKCRDNVQCPHMSRQHQSNHAPFLASGGFTYSVSARSTIAKQRAALDFCFYISDPTIGYWDVAYPGSFLDPLRRSHTVPLSNPDSPQSRAFRRFGWEQRQLPMLRDTTDFNFLHDNYVLDLRILGANEYQEAGTVPHLVDMCKEKTSVYETALAITASWRSITDTYGLKSQRGMYRDTLGLPPYVESPTKTTHVAFRWNVVLPILIVIVLALLGLIFIVLKQRHTIKYKTRETENAPKGGNGGGEVIAILFTDVEGSTALWDASESVMSRALDMHHRIVRDCIQRHSAYEVKTIGDSFMVAVGNADDAVLLANDIQTELLNGDWPIELASMPSTCVEFFQHHYVADVERRGRGSRFGLLDTDGICDGNAGAGGADRADDDAVMGTNLSRGYGNILSSLKSYIPLVLLRRGQHRWRHHRQKQHPYPHPNRRAQNGAAHRRLRPPRLMFRGLRVRIGIHVGSEPDGEIQVLYDDITKGFDYYGQITNAASRIEALGFGGQTLISTAVLDRLSENVKKLCVISPIGELNLRGVSSPVMIHQCLPLALRGRRFPGVYRRTDSMGSSMAIVNNDGHHDVKAEEDDACFKDRVADVMTLTPVELQSSVLRLRAKLDAFEAKVQKCSKEELREDVHEACEGIELAKSSLSLRDGESFLKKSE